MKDCPRCHRRIYDIEEIKIGVYAWCCYVCNQNIVITPHSTAKKDTEALAPCPFCGGKAYLRERKKQGLILHPKTRRVSLWEVGCAKNAMCPCWTVKDKDESIGGYIVKMDAIKAWNRRA